MVVQVQSVIGKNSYLPEMARQCARALNLANKMPDFHLTLIVDASFVVSCEAQLRYQHSLDQHNSSKSKSMWKPVWKFSQLPLIIILQAGSASSESANDCIVWWRDGRQSVAGKTRLDNESVESSVEVLWRTIHWQASGYGGRDSKCFSNVMGMQPRSKRWV